MDVLETMILGSLASSMSLVHLLKAWEVFKTEFVDWNEVRISSASEVSEVISKANDPLQLAMQLKEMMQVIFERRHMLNLEFIHENSIVDVKEFFKRSPDLPDLARQLVLSYVKGQPAVPLETWAQGGLIRAGLLTSSISSAQRQRKLFEELNEIPLLHAVLALHDEARKHPDPAVEKALRLKAEQAKVAALKAAKAAKIEAMKKAAEEKAIAKAAKDEALRIEREKVARKKAAEKAARDKIAKKNAEKAAKVKAVKDKAAKAKAAKDKVAKAKAAKAKAAKAKAIKDKAAKAKAAKDKAAKAKTAKDKAAKAKTAKDKAAKAKAAKKTSKKSAKKSAKKV
ncbi:MAG: hypothetical protein HN598_12695, partial [Planctomycetes bacterium]|nr:hypothetical protein [Planctomycetota bacterium]